MWRTASWRDAPGVQLDFFFHLGLRRLSVTQILELKGRVAALMEIVKLPAEGVGSLDTPITLEAHLVASSVVTVSLRQRRLGVVRGLAAHRSHLLGREIPPRR